MKLQEIFTYYNLGTIVEKPREIDGGLMHMMYSVRTTSKQYALKRLNPEIMKRKGVLHHITVSERIGQLFEKIVPAVPALTIENKPVFKYEDTYYIIFNWCEGHSIFPPDITTFECSIMGDILGKMHSSCIEVTDLTKETVTTPLYEWNKYLRLGREANSEWIPVLENIIESLVKWNKNLVKANESLRKNLVISHRDLDPKNVMWHNSEPYLIDWEAAGYVNPYQELLEVLNDWADNGDGSLDVEKFKALYNAYKKYDNCKSVEWANVSISGYGGMLGWLEYSFKRSLGIESENDKENALGTEQIFSTIDALIKYDQNVSEIKKWL